MSESEYMSDRMSECKNIYKEYMSKCLSRLDTVGITWSTTVIYFYKRQILMRTRWQSERPGRIDATMPKGVTETFKLFAKESGKVGLGFIGVRAFQKLERTAITNYNALVWPAAFKAVLLPRWNCCRRHWLAAGCASKKICQVIAAESGRLRRAAKM